MSFFSQADNDSGKLQTRIDLGVSSLTRLVQNFFIDILPLFANAIVALIIMFAANFWVGMVGLVLLPIYFVVSQMQAKHLSGFRRRMRGFREQKSGRLVDLISSISVIKSFVREPEEAERHLRIQKDMTDNQLNTRKLSFIYDAVKTFLEQIGVVIIILLTAYFVLDGQMSLGAVMFHILLFNNVSAPIRQLHRIYDQVNDAQTYAEGFFEILDAEATETTGSYQPRQIRGHIEMRAVDFTYPSGTRALHQVSMTIKPNQITALVGLSGAGKSTIINLLEKFYVPDSGDILLDGKPLSEYDTAYLRENIGLVLQKNHIFSGSIQQNIAYGKPDASMDEIIAAAKQAALHTQIEKLPEGYATQATELSGGQQQRIALARMFLKDPAIVFLDEPTASLDAIATQDIKHSIDRIKQNRTVIVVSHNLAHIIDADHIVVIEEGRVQEAGTHEELYARGGAYFDIFSAMSEGLNLEKIANTLVNTPTDGL